MTDYFTLLNAAQQNPSAADFMALRLAFTQSSLYNPYQDHPDQKALQAALDQGNNAEAAPLIQSMLHDEQGKYYLDPMLHIMASHIYQQLHQAEHHAYHKAWARGLIDAIFASGDGRSYQTAFKVIDTREEYVIINVIGGVMRQQSLQHHDDIPFDVLSVAHPQTGELIELYFNIEIPFTWLNRNFTGKIGL